MSIIRQRRKNLLLSGILGFMLATVTLVVGGFIFRQVIAEKLDLTPVMAVEEAVFLPSIVAARPIEKGSLLDGDDVMTIMVEENSKVKDHYSDITDLIGKKTALNIDVNMPMTPGLFVEEAIVHKDLRLFEVSFVELPYTLAVGDVVDIRIAFPTGQEYVVLSKKVIKGFERRVNNVHQGLLNLALEEGEALSMSSALVDGYIAEGTRVYMVKYVDPDQQEAAEVNYPVNEHVLQLLQTNPNILESPDVGHLLQARGLLNSALVTLLDDNDLPIYKVDMTTPGMTAGNGSADSQGESMDAPPETPTTAPEEKTSTSSTTNVESTGGIGF